MSPFAHRLHGGAFVTGWSCPAPLDAPREDALVPFVAAYARQPGRPGHWRIEGGSVVNWEAFVRDSNEQFRHVAFERECPGSQAEAEMAACPSLPTPWDDDSPAAVAYGIAGAYLQVASDHMEGLARVVYRGSTESAVAPFALARAVAEAAATAGWLTEDVGKDPRNAAIVRGSRVLTLTLESEVERQHQASRITGQAVAPDPAAASVIAATEGHPYFTLKRNVEGVAIRVGNEAVPKRGELQARLTPNGRHGYFVLSSVSHGVAFAALGQIAAATMDASSAQMSRQTALVAALTAMGEAATRLADLKGLNVSELQAAVDLLNDVHSQHMEQLDIDHPGSRP